THGRESACSPCCLGAEGTVTVAGNGFAFSAAGGGSADADAGSGRPTGACTIAKITGSAKPAALSCLSCDGDVSKLDWLDLIFATRPSVGSPILLMSRISLFVNAEGLSIAESVSFCGADVAGVCACDGVAAGSLRASCVGLKCPCSRW